MEYVKYCGNLTICGICGICGITKVLVCFHKFHKLQDANSEATVAKSRVSKNTYKEINAKMIKHHYK